MTILATGFGLNSVDGIEERNNRQAEKDSHQRIEDREIEAAKEAKRNRYYGTDNDKSSYKIRPHIFYFRPDDLDNEEIILKVEETPTYKRTKMELKELKGSSDQDQDDDEKDKGDKFNGTIKFA